MPGNILQPEDRRGGWHSRGYMPHFDSAHAVQHVSFHLADSLPIDAIQRMESQLELMEEGEAKRERRRRIDALMDLGHGSCILREAAVALMVEECLLHFDGQRYRLIEWAIMPNHVHTLFQTMHDWPMERIVNSWKSFTGRRIADIQVARKRLESPACWSPQPGEFQVWHREYWDRFVRDERHFAALVQYVRLNPVKAGLCKRPEDWLWGSARRGQKK